MINECRERNLPPPIYKYDFSGFIVEFINRSTSKTEGAIEGATKGVKSKLVELLKIIAANEGKRVPDYKTVTGLPESTIERYIKILKDANLVIFKGDAAHTGGYYLTKKLSNKLQEK